MVLIEKRWKTEVNYINFHFKEIYSDRLRKEVSMSWGKLLDLLSFSVFSIFSLWIGIVFLQETVDSIPCPQSY